MPRLEKEKAQETADAESTFTAYDEGLYIGTLAEVTGGHPGDKGEYWRWRFTDNIEIETDKKWPGSLWVNTSLSEDSAWKLKEMFDAFEVPPDTDTDELLGQQVQLVVSQVTIQKGARFGDLGNQVDRVMPLGAGEPEEEEAPPSRPKARTPRPKAAKR